ncbi:ketopantoate reductase family protein [Solicola gregarius]|uniref:2-dehydropantoate 2-reductase n=1 Tax=Solicola gregarius TaxID=2908642 RepID=A0AA46TK44_9ACTN|nr:2-dehydropantoate 2-reductase [Solicola gregarius]UYM06804.1 2-dehydropantoate 2-reductase [Solicola gregarius]
MKYVVLGAGAIGGVVGGRLAQAGHDVTLIARGPHLAAMRESGLRIESPTGTEKVDVRAVGDPAEVDWTDDHAVLLAVKSQQTDAALESLAVAASARTPVVCLQNGVANERAALRLFANVYAVCVALPATHLVPGVVQAWSSPVTGMLDLGRHPGGVDATAETVAEDFRSAAFDSYAVDDIARWKYRKLLSNLGNAIEVICGHDERGGRLDDVVRAEGEAVLAAAGHAVATADEDRARRSGVLRIGDIHGKAREGGSSWQSVQRQTGDIETDYLNGEIVQLGRVHDVPTPANELLQRLARDRMTKRLPDPIHAADVLRMLEHTA